jgi:hypothetical protein
MTNQAWQSVRFSTDILAEKRVSKITKLFFYSAVALALSLAIASPSAHADASSARDGSKASAHLNFRIIVPAIVRVKALAQALGVTVTQDDVDRGHLDLDAASQLMLTSNSRGGYLISANFDTEILDGVEIKLLNQTLHADARKGTRTMHVQSSILIDEVVGVGYRLYLKSGLKAGHYHWPVALAFMPNSGCGAC